MGRLGAGGSCLWLLGFRQEQITVLHFERSLPKAKTVMTTA